MSQLRINIAANFFGKGWSSIMGLVFTPLYVKALGIESYGLIGIYVTAQAVLSVLDFGLGTALNREMARHYGSPERAAYLRNLARTIEIFYWGVALVIGAGAILLSPALASNWIGNRSLANEVVVSALTLMGWAIALQWPFVLYSAGMNGLQKQLQLNKIAAIWGTLRWGGAAIVVLFVSQTIQAFFIWQAVTALAQSVTTARVFWGMLPGVSTPARGDWAILREVRHFASGVAGASMLGIVLTQLDKIMLSKLLPLEQFAYYSLAATLASALYMAVSPVVTAVFPRMSELVARSDKAGFFRTFHKTGQLVATLIFPLAWTLILFAEDILLLWTGNAEITSHASLLVSLIAAGTLLNAATQVPHALLLAHGISRFWFYVNLVSVLLLVPAILILTRHFGAVGAPVAWIALNLGYLFIAVPLMPIPRTERLRWYKHSIFLPMAAVGTVSGVIKLARAEHFHGWPGAFWIALSLAAGLLATFMLFRRADDQAARRLLF